MGVELINMTPGTRSHADYTWPGSPGYTTNDRIYQSIFNFEKASPSGLNGFILLMHMGTDPARTQKFYKYLGLLITDLRAKGYRLETVEELLR
jgi:hypothetical protein